MSVPLFISKEDLREQEYFNYSAIDQYWQERGYTEDILRIHYKLLISFGLVIFLGVLGLYYAAYRTRKKMNLAKRLGEEPRTRWETFCHEFELGQEPSINFVSSCLMTNDRVYVTLRLILAVWSLSLTLLTWAGARSILLGAYYPLAMIITVHVSRNRHLIVEGFGSKMQFLNKLLSWISSCQFPWQIFVTAHWWTKWFGRSRYRDMMKNFDRSRAVLLQEEFCPLLFLLTEMLWFDTPFDILCCLHPLVLIAGLDLQFILNAFKKDGGSANTQLIIHVKENPAASAWQFWWILFLYPLSGLPIVLFTKAKMWIFTKIPVIRERLEIRTQCIAIFRKRRIFNKFLPKNKVEGRKSAGKASYLMIGRTSINREETMMRNSSSRTRKTAISDLKN